jgi:hypothetical protein
VFIIYTAKKLMFKQLLKSLFVCVSSHLYYLSFAQNTLVMPDKKIVYPHQVFWSKIEINDFFKQTQYKWGYGFDVVYRRKSGLNDNNMFSQPLRESYRPWVHYQFNPDVRFSLSPIGYMLTDEYLGKPSDMLRLPYHEWRTTFQFFHHIYSGSNKKWMHTFRYRYELRWQDVPGSSEYRYLSRFRYRYRVRYLINKASFYDNHLWYTSLSNELGINIGGNVVMNTFNQNRLYAGVGFRFANVVRLELRYVNRFRTRGATGYEFDNGQGLMIGVYVDKLSKLKWRKDKYVTPVHQSD